MNDPFDYIISNQNNKNNSKFNPVPSMIYSNNIGNNNGSDLGASYFSYYVPVPVPVEQEEQYPIQQYPIQQPMYSNQMFISSQLKPRNSCKSEQPPTCPSAFLPQFTTSPAQYNQITTGPTTLPIQPSKESETEYIVKKYRKIKVPKSKVIEPGTQIRKKQKKPMTTSWPTQSISILPSISSQLVTPNPRIINPTEYVGENLSSQQYQNYSHTESVFKNTPTPTPTKISIPTLGQITPIPTSTKQSYIIKNPPISAAILEKSASIGDMKLELTIPEEADIGMDIIIDPNGNKELHKIIGLGSFILDLPLQNNYPAGTIIAIYHEGSIEHIGLNTIPTSYMTNTSFPSSMPMSIVTP